MMHSNSEIIYSNEEIFQIIPQRPPFVFIDVFYRPLQDTFFSSYLIKQDNPLVIEGVVQETGLLENIAQTAAAGNGYKALLEKTTPKVGFIGAIKKSKLYQLPLAGTIIHTRAKIITELLNAMIVEGEITNGNGILLSCQLNIFLKN